MTVLFRFREARHGLDFSVGSTSPGRFSPRTCGPSAITVSCSNLSFFGGIIFAVIRALSRRLSVSFRLFGLAVHGNAAACSVPEILFRPDPIVSTCRRSVAGRHSGLAASSRVLSIQDIIQFRILRRQGPSRGCADLGLSRSQACRKINRGAGGACRDTADRQHMHRALLKGFGAGVGHLSGRVNAVFANGDFENRPAFLNSTVAARMLYYVINLGLGLGLAPLEAASRSPVELTGIQTHD